MGVLFKMRQINACVLYKDQSHAHMLEASLALWSWWPEIISPWKYLVPCEAKMFIEYNLNTGTCLWVVEQLDYIWWCSGLLFFLNQVSVSYFEKTVLYVTVIFFSSWILWRKTCFMDFTHFCTCGSRRSLLSMTGL